MFNITTLVFSTAFVTTAVGVGVMADYKKIGTWTKTEECPPTLPYFNTAL